MQTPVWPVVNASDYLQQYFVICKVQPGQAQTSQVSWHLYQWLSLSDCFIMQTPACPVVNALDCLRQYFVICKEQTGQAQTSQVSWHFITCMCPFWQRNWINDCLYFMWIQCGFDVDCKQRRQTEQYDFSSITTKGLKQPISGVPEMGGSDKLIRSCR